MDYKVDSESRMSSSFDVPAKSIPVSQIKTPTKQHIQIVALKQSPVKQHFAGGQLRAPVTAVPVSLQGSQPTQVVYYASASSAEGLSSQLQGAQRVSVQAGPRTLSFQARLPSGPTITLTRPAVVSAPLIALTPSQLVAQPLAVNGSYSTNSGHYANNPQPTPTHMQRTASALQGHTAASGTMGTSSNSWKAWSPPNHQLIAQQIPIDVDAEETSQQHQSKLSGGDGNKKPCHCNKSQCLKLYCECFAAGEFCSGCNCQNCANNLEHEDERNKAIKQCLERNPTAFHPKIMKSMAGKELIGERRQSRGCNCKRSGCWKNYCECYEAKVACTAVCKCVGCRNCPEAQRGNLSALNSSDSLLPSSTSTHNSGALNHHRTQQSHVGTLYDRQLQKQLATKSRLALHHNYQRQPTQQPSIKLPHKLFTPEVIEATCACLLAVADESETSRTASQNSQNQQQQQQSQQQGVDNGVAVERAILEEFGRCLAQIIEVAYRPITSGSS